MNTCELNTGAHKISPKISPGLLFGIGVISNEKSEHHISPWASIWMVMV